MCYLPNEISISLNNALAIRLISEENQQGENFEIASLSWVMWFIVGQFFIYFKLFYLVVIDYNIVLCTHFKIYHLLIM